MRDMADYPPGTPLVVYKASHISLGQNLPIVNGEIVYALEYKGTSPFIRVRNSYGLEGIVSRANVQLADIYIEEDFFVPDLTSKMSSIVLEDEEPGTFLVRSKSYDPDRLVISAKFDKVIHYSFCKKSGGIEFDGKSYQSVPIFVNKCSQNQILGAGKLTKWIKQSDLQLPQVRRISQQTPQILSRRIVAGCTAVAVEDVFSTHKLCLTLELGKVYVIVKACRDPQYYIARDEYENEGFVSSSALECYIPEWFHGRMERELAEQMLNRACRDGTFLVRERPSEPGMFALSVWCPDGIVHVPLAYKNGQVSPGENGDLPLFSCLLELVDHYRHETVFWTVNQQCVRILFPLSRKESSLPDVIQEMDMKSVEMYIKALKMGTEHVRDIRVMLVGHHGAGKTTLTERLMGKPFTKVGSTDGIDVHVHQCQFNVRTGTWRASERPGSAYLDDDASHSLRLLRLIESPDEDRTSVLEDFKNRTFPGTPGGSSMGTGSGKASPELTSQGVETQERSSIGSTGSEISTDPSSMEKSASTPDDSLQEPQSGENGAQDMVGMGDDLTNSQYEIALENDLLRYKFSMGTLKVISDTFGKKRWESNKENRCGFISMWDFAGQYIFYATHQVFLSSRAVYLLVLNLSKDLNDLIEDEDFPLETCHNEIQGQRVQDYGDFWLRSIHTFCGDTPGEPPVILVGSHKDQMKCAEEERDAHAEQYFENFRKVVEKSPVAKHIQPEQFALDNTSSAEDFNKLKEAIVNVAKRQHHWYQEVPARWLALERCLGKLRSTANMVTLSEIMEINRVCELACLDEEEIQLFLRYQHAVGKLIYFDDEELADTVVMDPQWIINAFKSFITAKKFCRLHHDLRLLWNDLQDKAKLHDELITRIWEESDNKSFQKCRDKLLLYMEKLDIIAKPKIEENGNILPASFYFVPSLLRVRSTQKTLEPHCGLDNCTCTPMLCFVFEEGYIPPTIFQRMLGDCLSMFSVLCMNQYVQLFSDFGVFKLDSHHCLVFKMEGEVMKMKIVNMVREDVKPALCDKIRRYMTSSLERELGRYCQNVSFTVCIECNRGGITNGDERINCRDLLRNGKMPCYAHEEQCIAQAEKILATWYPDYVDLSQVSSSVHSWIEECPIDVKNRLLTPKDFSKLAQILGFNWEFVLIELGLSQIEIDQAKLDNKDRTAMQIYTCLQKWKSKAGSKTTAHELVKAIVEHKPTVSVDWDKIKNIVDEIY